MLHVFLWCEANVGDCPVFFFFFFGARLQVRETSDERGGEGRPFVGSSAHDGISHSSSRVLYSLKKWSSACQSARQSVVCQRRSCGRVPVKKTRGFPENNNTGGHRCEIVVSALAI